MANELIKKRVDELTKKFLDQYDYVDLNALGPYYNKTTKSNEIAVFKDAALVNTVRMWMLSKAGDYYREPQRGGIIDEILGTKMTQENLNNLKSYMINKFKSEFTLVEIVQLDLTADPISRTWKVAFQVLDIINKTLVNFSVNVQV
jgi:cobyric acid synthase